MPDAGASSAATAALHAKLVALGFDIGADELQQATVGATTKAAISAFQLQQGLKVTGLPNKQTVGALGDAQPAPVGPDSSSQLSIVSGVVSSPDSPSTGGLQVQLVDKNVGGDVVVATGQTGPSGDYTCRAVIAPADLEKRGKTSPDLQVQVLVGGNVVTQSEVAYGGEFSGPVDLSLPAGTTGLASEYETLTAALRLVYSGPLDQIQEANGRQDITYLASKAGWDARAIAMRALADRLAAGDGAPAATGIDPALYYALFRAGVGTDAAAVYGLGATVVKSVWTQAIADNVIPASLAGQVDAAVQSFTTVAASRALTASPLAGPSTLGQLLDVSLGSDAAAQQRFAELYVQGGDDPEGFWQQVEAAFGPDKTASLQLDGKLAYLLVNNAPLLGALHAAQPLASPSDLASNGYAEPAAWLTLLAGVDPPSEVPGDTPDEQKAGYAAFLAAQVRISFPTESIGHLVSSGGLELSSEKEVGAEVATFLHGQGGTFDIGAEPVAAFLSRTGTSLSPEATAEIARIQRVYQIAPDTQSLAAMLNGGLDSAYAIVRQGTDTLASRFNDSLGEATLKTIAERALTIHGATLQVAVNYLSARVAPTLGGSTIALIDPVGGTASTAAASAPAAQATLDDLFRNLDYCACDDCGSITSPAAYLVDLLEFLDHPSAAHNPLAALLARRPDIGDLKLTCENTNTVLPYLDLVNEALEYYVGNSLSLAQYRGHDNNGSVSSAELLAAPQFDDDPAAGNPYATLEGAWFPPPLPFHRNLELLRLHLSQIGTSLHELLEAFRTSEALEAATPADATSYAWRDILAERLALSRPRNASALGGISGEYRLLTDSSLTLAQLHGFPTGTADSVVIGQLAVLREYSRRTGVDYDDLVSILETRFVNPGSPLLPLVTALSVSASVLGDLHAGTLTTADFAAKLPSGLDPARYGGTTVDDIAAWVLTNYHPIMTLITIDAPDDPDGRCDSSLMTLRYLNPDATANTLQPVDFVRLLRFIRLWRKLGLSVPETDALIAALSPPDSGTGTALTQLDEVFMTLLPRIGLAYATLDELGLGPDDGLDGLLSCWATIGDALYAQMFLTRSVLEQDPVFTLDETGVPLAGGSGVPLAGHKPGLCAALNLTAAELELLVGPAPGLGLASGNLTLENVSAIFRHAWLARTLELSIVELLHLIADTGIDPFALPTLDAAKPVDAPLLDFVRLVRTLSSAGMEPVQALYLLWNDDLSGISSPDPRAVRQLAAALRSAFIAVDDQFSVAANPTLDAAKALATLVLGSQAADVFFGLLNETLVTSVPFGYTSATLPDAVLAAGQGRISYDDLAKQLGFAGYLDAATLAAIQAAAAGDAALLAAITALGTQNQQVVDGYFARYESTGLDLKSLFQAYTASPDPAIRGSLPALLAGLLPALAARRKEEQALAAAASSAGCPLSFATTLLADAAVLPAAAGAAAPTGPQVAGAADLTALAQAGLSVDYFLTDDVTAPPGRSESAVGLTFGPEGPQSLPSPSAGSAIAATWRGFVAAPQAGDYNLAVGAAAGSTVTLVVGGQPVTMAATSPGTFVNTGVVSLPSGSLTELELTVTGLTDSLSVSWETVGLGWQPVPQVSLYSSTLVSALAATYLRFLKASAVAEDLRLDADELAALARSPELQVGGQGWLSALTTSGVAPSAQASDLSAVLGGLLAYAELKRRLPAGSTSLLAVFQDIGSVLPNGSRAIAALTGWDPASIDALAQRLFGTTALASLGTPLRVLRRLAEPFALVGTTGVSIATFIAAASNDPSRQLIADFQAAVRSRYAEADWLAVVTPISNTVRELQRDATVAYILAVNGPAILQELGIATTRKPTADDLFDYFLMDVEMEACMDTSRVRHALSSVQLFIERCLRNLEPSIDPGTLDARAWQWMKRYRVWQANREVFLWPENWLDPSLRDDKSPIFNDALGQLLQGDITDDSAAGAFLDYLSGLELVAKLELCGMYYEPPAPDGSSGEVVHVVGRTSGVHRKHYYRRLEVGSWSPWEEIKLTIEDNPVVPYVWNGRLLLLWLQIKQSSALDPSNITGALPAGSGASKALSDTSLGELATAVSTAAPSAADVRIEASLCFSEYYNGKWQPPKTSQPDDSLELGGTSWVAGSFDRSLVELRPWTASDSADQSLYVQVAFSTSYPVPGFTREGFVLHNTHSSPSRWAELLSLPSLSYPSRERLLLANSDASLVPLSARGHLGAGYAWVEPPSGGYAPPQILHTSWVDILAGRFLLTVRSPEPNVADQWGMPFVMEDAPNAFYVTTQAARRWFPLWSAYGLTGVPLTNKLPDIARVVPGGPPPTPGDPVVNSTPGRRAEAGADGAPIRFVIGSEASVDFGGTRIGALAGEALANPEKGG